MLYGFLAYDMGPKNYLATKLYGCRHGLVELFCLCPVSFVPNVSGVSGESFRGSHFCFL